jgi:hypothetical protein
MERDKFFTIAMIAIILGAIGLGIGVYSVISMQSGTIKGDDGDDGDDGQDAPGGTNIYYCSSQSEIENALDIIGTGHGTIIVTENITLSSQIDINDRGNYIIQGAGAVTLFCYLNKVGFDITNVQSLIV